MKNLFYILTLAIFIFSCQTGKEKIQDTPETILFENQRNAFFNSIKTAPDAAAELRAIAAEFNGDLLNDPNKYSDYVGDTIKSAANLGIYLSDLNYCVAFQQSDRTKELFTAANELSKVIGIEKSVIDFLMTRFNENINQNDSVKAVINELFENSTTKLEGTAKERFVGIAMAAYQIENLHLALGVIATYPKDMLPDDARTQILIPAFKLVLGQKNNIETIYNFLQTLVDPAAPEKTPNYAYYNTAFEELIAVYNRLNVDQAIADNKGIELLNDQVVMELSAKVNAIRDKIISL